VPIERLELAIYRRIKSQSNSPIPIPATLRMFGPNPSDDLHPIAEAVWGLAGEGRIKLSKIVGTLIYKYEELDEALPAEMDVKKNFIWSEFRIQITPQGRKYFERLEELNTQEHLEPLVFISCGQFHPNEKALGKQIEVLVNTLPKCRGYFADNQSSVQALSDHIFRALDRCSGLVAVMHHRGTVQTLGGAKHVRASVWIEQEIAVAAFIAATSGKDIPVILYVQEGIKREGVRDFLILNTVEFKNDQQVLADFEARIKDGRFKPAVPAWSG
jgi:hypothetical protein